MKWRTLVKLAKKEYGLKEIHWAYNNRSKWKGKCDYQNGVIKLNYFMVAGNEEEKIRSLFHELGHIHCYQNGLWKGSHNPRFPLNRKDKKTLILTALKAEKWIDNWAEQELKKYYPSFKYKKEFSTKEGIKTYRNEILSKY
jgi:predicted SprT family Zn-dependent metalloprotease